MTDFTISEVQNIEDIKRRLASVKELVLSDLGLEDLPDCVGLLNHIEALDVSGNRFKTVPIVLRKLINVEKLDLWDNKLKTLPRWLSELKQINYFSMKQNPVAPKDLPQNLQQLDSSNRRNMGSWRWFLVLCLILIPIFWILLRAD